MAAGHLGNPARGNSNGDGNGDSNGHGQDSRNININTNTNHRASTFSTASGLQRTRTLREEFGWIEINGGDSEGELEGEGQGEGVYPRNAIT